MMLPYKGLFRALFISIVLTAALSGKIRAQGLLYKRISVQAHYLPLENVLDRIAKNCGFSFSYNSNIIPRDSLVTVSITNAPVKDVLDILFQDRFEYREVSGYVVLRYAPLRLSLITDKVQNDKGVYRISGFVADDRTGARVAKASVYEKKLLRSALTRADGSFDIKINTLNHSIALTVSKELYRDTTVLILTSVHVNPYGSIDGGGYDVPGGRADVAKRTAVGRMLVSYKQKIQELNVPGFIAESPVQASITPGLSSHGMLSGQVINNVSFNIIGGYTAGVEGVEAGGMFNINKKYVKGVQAAGMFNLVGTEVAGVQAGGVYNGVLGSVKGVQAGGISNFVIEDFSGVQAGGLLNFVRGRHSGVQAAGLLNFVLNAADGVQTGGFGNVSGASVSGVQAAGLFNAVRYHLTGIQVAGIVNIAGGDLNGAQVGLVNAASRMKGFQFGLVNIADTSAGVSIGLVNIVRKNGIHSLSVSANEITSRNLTLRTGTPRLYTIVHAGHNLAGLGFGKEYNVSSHLHLNPEIAGFYLYQGSSDYTNSLIRVPLNLTLKVNRFLSVLTGPSFNVFYADQDKAINGYTLITDRIKTFRFSEDGKFRGWFGWSAGISLF